MSASRSDLTSRAMSGLAGAAAAFGARKVIFFLWKRITGQEPPAHPEDPAVRLAEALGWALVVGAAVNTARVLATRAAISQRPGLGLAEETTADQPGS